MTGEAPAAYEEKSVPSSGRGPSISRSPALLPRCRIAAIPASSPAAVLPRRDKVVTLLDKIRNTRHVNRPASPPHWGPIWTATSQPSHRPPPAAGNKSGNVCVDGCLILEFRFCATSPLRAWGLALLIGSGGALAQSGTPAPQDQSPRRRPPMPPTPARTTSARPTNSSRRRRPSTARPETPNASGSAAAWSA